MERLFRERMDYVSAAGGEQGCFICDAIARGPSEENLLLGVTQDIVTIVNRFPYNSGHLMIAPSSHIGELDEASSGVRAALMEGVARAVSVLGEEYGPDGFNVGMNLGRTAGAGLPGHLHVHVVPRWDGDTNFMPVAGGAKVIPEPLADTYRRLSPHFST